MQIINLNSLQFNSIPKYYITFVSIVILSWLSYIYTTDKWYIIGENVAVIITMIFGAFLAGSSPEGSASLAYPVFTLYLDILPSVARNFAFAIQSVGMTAASIFILNRKIHVDWQYIFYVSISGLLGLVIGTYFVNPYITPQYAKLSFVSLWLAFGIILYVINKQNNRIIKDKIEIESYHDILLLLLFGLIGGCISSIFGTGINIFSFCFVVLYYHVNEKVATPSSIIIMTIETIAGFFLHSVVENDMEPQAYDMWISCIPLVIFMAPLGAYAMSRVSRKTFNNFLYLIFALQYIFAMLVLKPSLHMMIISLGIIGLGMFIFLKISAKRKLESQ